MSQLTQAQVVAYNKKVTAAKEKASEDKARKDLAEKELTRTCEELTQLLGKTITPENLEDEYAKFVAEAEKTMTSGNTILDGLEQEQADAMDRGDTSVPVTAAETTTTTPVGAQEGPIDLDSLMGL